MHPGEEYDGQQKVNNYWLVYFCPNRISFVKQRKVSGGLDDLDFNFCNCYTSIGHFFISAKVAVQIVDYYNLAWKTLEQGGSDDCIVSETVGSKLYKVLACNYLGCLF